MDIIEEEVKTKRCSKCGRILPLSEFDMRKRAKDGLRSECKQCHKAMQTQYYSKNKKKIAEHMAEYYAKNKEAIAQRQAEYYKKNKASIQKKHAAYRVNNKETIKVYNAAYNAIHKAEIKAYFKAYRDPILSPLGWAKQIVNTYRQTDKIKGFDPNQTISAEWFLQNIAYKPCKYCGKQGIGLIGCNRIDNSKGHTQDNVEAACMSCNSRLGAIYQLERGIHISQLRKKQSFSDFVDEHKAKHKKD